jgi:hypothetical protein
VVKGFDSNSTTPGKLSCFASFLSGWTSQIIFNILPEGDEQVEITLFWRQYR